MINGGVGLEQILELIIAAVMESAGQRKLNVGLLKMKVKELAPTVQKDEDIDGLVKQLLEMSTMGEAK